MYSDRKELVEGMLTCLNGMKTNLILVIGSMC